MTVSQKLAMLIWKLDVVSYASRALPSGNEDLLAMKGRMCSVCTQTKYSGHMKLNIAFGKSGYNLEIMDTSYW
jgi:hypothetical protein